MCFTNINSRCSMKDPAKKMKRQTTDGEKMFANHTSEKGLEYVNITQNSTVKIKNKQFN